MQALAKPEATKTSLDLTHHRFGVNYTPSYNWWYCWNDWHADPIKRDLDAIAALGADHLRIFPIWPFFQPNPKQVSPPTWNGSINCSRSWASVNSMCW